MLVGASFVGLPIVIERLNRIKLPGQEYNNEDLKEWATEALEKIGCIEAFQEYSFGMENYVELPVVNYIATLPTNFKQFIALYDTITRLPLIELSPEEQFKDLSFKIYNGTIRVDFEEGNITLEYFTFPFDDNGWPLIPNNTYYLSAVEAYLRLQLGTKLYWQGKILERQKDMLEREWLFYCNGSKMQAKIISKERMKRTLLRNFPAIDRVELPTRPDGALEYGEIIIP
jgi:hypothetical protein